MNEKYTIPTKVCICCKVSKTFNKFYVLKGIHDSYCKECRKLKARQKTFTASLGRILQTLEYYGKFPQFDYTQEHSLAIFAAIDNRLWPVAIDYINEKYRTNYNFKDTYLHLDRIGAYVSRYFTFKKCVNCLEYKQTYVNSLDQNYVIQVLMDVQIPIIEAEFKRNSNAKDGWSIYCNDCAKALRGVRATGRLSGSKNSGKYRRHDT